MKKAIGYARVSTHKQASEGVSLSQQRTKIHKKCDLDDYVLDALYSDEGASAKDLDRPGLQRALSALENGEADTLIIYKLDRLTRSVKDLGELIEEYFDPDQDGASLVVIQEDVDTGSPTGRLVMNMLMSVSQWEREVIAERTSRAMSHMRQELKYTGGKTPLGFRRVTPDGRPDDQGSHLAPCPDEWPAVRRMVELRIERGASYRQTAEILEDEGHISTSAASVRNVVDRVGEIYDLDDVLAGEILPAEEVEAAAE